MTAGDGVPPGRSSRRWMGVALLVSVGFLGFVLGKVMGALEAAQFAATVREETDAERQARNEQLEKETRAAADSLRARLDAATKRIAALEETLRAREAGTVPQEQPPAPPPIDPPRGEAPPAAAVAVAPAPVETAPVSAPTSPGPPPPRTLGPTAVTDGGQVKKVLDSLNALLAGIGGKEIWRVTAAEAVDGDRLVGARLEGRTAGGDVARAYRAAEARFVLLTATRTLEVRLRDGDANYPGERSVAFVDGRYTLALDVDPAPWRNSAHPLIEVR